MEIALDQIIPNPRQPRVQMDESELKAWPIRSANTVSCSR